MMPNPVELQSESQRQQTLSPALPPELIEVICSAVVALVLEQQLAKSTPAEPVNPSEKNKGQSKWASLRAQFWQIVLALLVSGTAFAGVFVYMRLTADFSQTGKELRGVRRELGLVRYELVRKEEFNGRHLAAQALIREIEANSRVGSERELQKLLDEKQKLAELRLRLKDLKREVERLGEQLSPRDKKPGDNTRGSREQE
jgi:hypothetical protein